MLHRSLPLVPVGLLLAACATSSTSPTLPASRTTDLTASRTTTGLRIQGTWMGAPWDVEVTPETITRKGNGKTRTWTRVEPGLYQLEGRPQMRARFQGAAGDPATAPLPETAFAVLLSQL